MDIIFDIYSSQELYSGYGIISDKLGWGFNESSVECKPFMGDEETGRPVLSTVWDWSLLKGKLSRFGSELKLFWKTEGLLECTL